MACTLRVVRELPSPCMERVCFEGITSAWKRTESLQKIARLLHSHYLAVANTLQAMGSEANSITLHGKGHDRSSRLGCAALANSLHGNKIQNFPTDRIIISVDSNCSAAASSSL